MDRDRSGEIDHSELSIAMRALGYSPADITEAILEGDCDGDGQLNFHEFAALIMTAESKPKAKNADTFPFALVANSYRISRLVDSYDPKETNMNVEKKNDADRAVKSALTRSGKPLTSHGP